MPYTFKKRKPALIFEILLPKRMSYSSKLQEVMDAFISDDSILSIPRVKRYIDSKTDPVENHKIFARHVREIITGYSIYEVDGRFSTPKGAVDERTWVIRIITHDPKSEDGMRDIFQQFAGMIVETLIGERFAEELGSEDEIWVIEYPQPFLRRWVKK